MASSKNISKFLRKLYSLLDNHQYSDSICWDCEGQNILIKDQQKLQTQIIPKYFSLKKFSSFVRQLHLYNFHKIKSKNNSLIFYNSLYHRDQRQQAAQIVRKRKTKASLMLIKEARNSQKTIEPELLISFESLNVEHPQAKQQLKIRSFQSLSSISFKSYEQLERIGEGQPEDIFDLL